MIHFLFGPNHFVIKAERQRLVKAFIAQHGEHGVEKYDGETLAPNLLRQLLHAGSLFTPSRLIVLNQPAAQKALWDTLADELKDIPDSTDLIVVEPAADKRTRTYRQLQQVARVVEAKEFDTAKLTTWVVDTLSSQGRAIDRQSAQYLVDRVGTDQSRLHNELKKLSLYENIDGTLIDTLVEASPQATVFELLDAVLGRQADKAGRLVEQLKTAEDPYKTFGLISSQVHTLGLVVAGKEKGRSAQQIAQDSGMHPFVITKTERLARGTGWPEVRGVIDILATLDDRLKRSGADPWLLLESALLKIASR